MESNINKEFNLYSDIRMRTNGQIFIGVVGPVRCGKSTFIKNFTELFIVPGIENTFVRTRVIDQLPQSGDGRTIMTTEPKFIPEEAVKIKINSTELSIRMVDCVGYLIPGVLGHMEAGRSRMVKTPWDNGEIPFEEAAEKGTTKVIENHSTVGIMVTTDGSFGEIPRENYVKAEEKTVNKLSELGKPFVIILNSTHPDTHKTKESARILSKKYSAPVIPMNCMKLNTEDVEKIFTDLLGMFPIREIAIDLPEYMDALPAEHFIKSSLVDTFLSWMENIDTMGSCEKTLPLITANSNIKNAEIEKYEMATGKVILNVKLNDGLYYEIIEELLNHPVSSDRELFMLLKEYSKAKHSYDDMSEAIDSVGSCGYGIVHPKLSQMNLGKPEVFKHGNKYGVKLIATAPCLHIIRTDITTEISPIVGTEQQSEDLARYLMEKFDNDDNRIWETNLFGKTLQELVSEQMEGKLMSMPQSLQEKVQKSLQKISDEGKDYFICIIL